MPASNLTPEQMERRRIRTEARKARKRAKRRETLRLYAEQAKANRLRLAAIGILGAAVFLWIDLSGYALGHGSQTGTAVIWASDEFTSFLETAKALSETEPIPTDSASELWSNDRSRIDTPLLDTDLDTETQWAIYKATGYDDTLFSTVMAIAWTESRFQADAASDSGNCIGLMQINTKWHMARMEALGATDLTDPVQNALVGMDYLKELESRYGFETGNEEIMMAYNMGPSGAAKAIAAGITSTEYSRTVMAKAQEYLAELGG